MNHMIPLDLELHKLIETHRLSLDETVSEIVKRVLRGERTNSTNFVSVFTAAPKGNRPSRKGGNYELIIFGKRETAYSLKDVLKKAILISEHKSPGFIEKLAQHRTSKGRRIVARRPEEIYPGKPNLVESCAERLDNKWWFDTNISNDQCQRYLSVLGDVGGFEAPTLK